ncbi:MAG TPA: Ig-like domain-containing protein, partial [Bacteroidales bacterium]|nr:Ig-like domain-containing protein [Bacteroidales bacterium]
MFNIRSAIKTRPAFYFTIAVYLILNACANPVMPTGGPKDTTPPKILKSNPRDRSTNFKSNKIEIEFNEYVKLNTGNNKILVSPPMKEAPEYKLSGKKLI